MDWWCFYLLQSTVIYLATHQYSSGLLYSCYPNNTKSKVAPCIPIAAPKKVDRFKIDTYDSLMFVVFQHSQYSFYILIFVFQFCRIPVSAQLHTSDLLNCAEERPSNFVLNCRWIISNQLIHILAYPLPAKALWHCDNKRNHLQK